MTYDISSKATAQLFAFPPDWGAGYEVRRSFQTDIITSRNGTEQRIALRQVPRLDVRYETLQSAAGLRQLNDWLRTRQNAPCALLDWSRYDETTAAASASDAFITCLYPEAWIADGELVVICDGENEELLPITTVSDPTVNLGTALANSYASGAIIRPAIYGLLQARLRATRVTRGAHRVQVLLDAYPGAEPPEDAGIAVDTFNGYEVFSGDEDFGSRPTAVHIYPVEQIDFGVGRTAQFRPIEQQEQLIECTYNGLSIAQAEAIEQVFLRAKGRRGAFYRSTCQADFDIQGDLSATTTIDVAGTTLADNFTGLDAPYDDTAIEIVLRNGTKLRRLISNITAVGGNSRITVTSAVTAAEADRARASWLQLVRFASDDLTTRWVAPGKAEIACGFQTVKAST